MSSQSKDMNAISSKKMNAVSSKKAQAVTNEWSIEQYSNYQDQFRATPTDQLTVSWPFMVTVPSKSTEEAGNSPKLQHACARILHKYGISIESIAITTLRTEGVSLPLGLPHDIMVFNTYDDNPAQHWELAANELQALIDHCHSAVDHWDPIHPEIRNQNRMYRDEARQNMHLSGLDVCNVFRDREIAAWEAIHKIVPGFSSVSMQLRGPPEMEQGHPRLVPTIMVDVQPGTDANWVSVAENIRKGLLQSHGTGVQYFDIRFAAGCMMFFGKWDSLEDDAVVVHPKRASGKNKGPGFNW